MNIFFAGATGVIGRQLLPRLIETGHRVTAITRSQERAAQIRVAGGHPVVVDVFDRERLMRAMRDAEPEVVMHQLTNIPERIEPRKALRDLSETNRLRTEGTQILMQAARAAGARLFVAQSIATFYAPDGSRLATESDPLYTNAPPEWVAIVQALQTHEDIVMKTPGITGIVLRYGFFYGPGTAYSADGTFTADVRRRRVPIIGNGQARTPLIHVEDAATATILAMNYGKPDIYNIVDDDPAPLREWLPYYAQLLGVPPPMRVTRFLGRLAAGPYGIFFMTQMRGASNTKAKRVLGWRLKYPSWRDGLRAELVGQPVLAGAMA